MERCRNHRREYDARSCTHLGEYPAENECVQFHGVSQRKKCNDDFRETCKLKVQVWKQKFLGNWILCEYSWHQYINSAKVYPRTG